jgi:hypothetical protein
LEDTDEHAAKENHNQMGGIDDQIFEGQYKEDAHGDGKSPLHEGEEMRSPTPKATKKSKSGRSKRKNATLNQEIFAHPKLYEIGKERILNAAPQEQVLADMQMGDEGLLVYSPKKASKKSKSKKVNGTPRGSTRAASTVIQTVVEQDVDKVQTEKVTSPNKPQRQKSRPEVSNSLKPRRGPSAELDTSNLSPRNRENSVDLPVLPAKMKTTKAKIKSAIRKSKTDTHDIAEEHENSNSVLHNPVAPIKTLHHHIRPRTQEQTASRTTVDIPPTSLTKEEVQQPELPKNSSGKSHGKRKASGTPTVHSNKKRKWNNKAPAGIPSMIESEVNSDGYDVAKSNKESLDSILDPNDSILATTAKRLYIELDSEPEDSTPLCLKPASENLPQHERATQWTPINSPEQVKTTSKTREVNPQSQSRAEINTLVSSKSPFVPSHSESSIPVPKSAEKRKRRLPTGESSSASKAVNALSGNTGLKAVKLTSSTPKSHIPSVTLPGSRFTDEEFETVREAVETWRDDNNMTQSEINDLIQKPVNKVSRAFWDHMTYELPNIPRVKLQQKCRRKFHNFERGTWTEELDAELRDLYEKYPRKWKNIGEHMNRFPEDCRDRWRNYLVCGDKQKKDTWDKAEEENLKVIFNECIEIIERERITAGESRISRQNLESLVDWNIISKKMGYTRSRLQCIGKWKALKQRVESDVEDSVAQAPVAETTWRVEEAEREVRRMSAKQKLDLLYAIRDSAAGSEGKIPWLIITKDMNVKGLRMALKVCYRILKQHVSGHQDMKLQEIIDELIDAYEGAAPNEPEGFNRPFKLSQHSTPCRKSKPPHKRRKPNYKDSSIDPSDDNGEGSTTPKKTKLTASHGSTTSKDLSDDHSESEDIEAPRSVKSQRSRVSGQSKMKPSEETASVAIIEDIENALGTLKNGKARAPARRNGKGTRNAILSNEYIQESDSESEEETRHLSNRSESRERYDGDQTHVTAPSVDGEMRHKGEHEFESPSENRHIIEGSDHENVSGNNLGGDGNHDVESSEAEESEIEESGIEESGIEESGIEESGIEESGIEESEIEESDAGNTSPLGFSDRDQEMSGADEQTDRAGPGEDEHDQTESFDDKDKGQTLNHDQASVDLDAASDDDHRITMNGWGNITQPQPIHESEEEDDDDDDNEAEEEYGGSPIKRLASPLFDHNDTPRAKRYTNVNSSSVIRARSLSTSSDGSDMSDIPAKPRSRIQTYRRDTSLEL